MDPKEHVLYFYVMMEAKTASETQTILTKRVGGESSIYMSV
jgi:hypothetical protein